MTAAGTPAGYSGTPLVQKLGLQPGGTMVLVNAPGSITAIMEPPDGAMITGNLVPRSRLIMLFCKDTAALKKELPAVAKFLAADGSLWVSWPKKTSRLFVDLTEDGIRAMALPRGLVDVKVCAVSDDWSGLKLMVRKENRADWKP